MEQASVTHHKAGEVSFVVGAVEDGLDKGSPEAVAYISKANDVPRAAFAQGVPNCSREAAPEPGGILIRIIGADLAR